MKILVLGGMHGNEPLGPMIVSMLRSCNIPNVGAALANEQALAKNCRFIEQDLNRSFPGDSASKQYETKRAAELLSLCGQYDLVLDFHNTLCPNNDCAFVGSSARPLLYKVSSWLGLRRVIVADYDCVNKYAPNCISVEISITSPRMDATTWVEKIKELAKLNDLPPTKQLQLYKFVYRMTLEDKARLKLDQQNLKAFKPLPRGLAEAMQVKSPAYPIFPGDNYTPYNFGGLLNKIDV
jgi:hypothetical protein